MSTQPSHKTPRNSKKKSKKILYSPKVSKNCPVLSKNVYYRIIKLTCSKSIFNTSKANM